MENSTNPVNPAENFDEKAKSDDMALVAEIREQVVNQCEISKYSRLCQRISTESGLTYVINRCIRMMADDELLLSAALAQLESELEGMD